jgi:hypothetical protein
MPRNVPHPVAYPAKRVGDKVFAGHDWNSGGRSVLGQTLATVVAPVHGPAKKNWHHWLIK